MLFSLAAPFHPNFTLRCKKELNLNNSNFPVNNLRENLPFHVKNTSSKPQTSLQSLIMWFLRARRQGDSPKKPGAKCPYCRSLKCEPLARAGENPESCSISECYTQVLQHIIHITVGTTGHPDAHPDAKRFYPLTNHWEIYAYTLTCVSVKHFNPFNKIWTETKMNKQRKKEWMI